MGATSTPNLGLIKPDLQEVIKANWTTQHAQNMNSIDEALRIAWDTYTPVWASSGTQPVIGSGGSIIGNYCELGKNFISVWILLRVGGTGFSAGSGNYTLSLPFNVDKTLAFETCFGVAHLHDDNSALNTQAGVPVISNTGNDEIQIYTDSSNFSWSPTAPFTLAQGDLVSVWMACAREV